MNRIIIISLIIIYSSAIGLAQPQFQKKRFRQLPYQILQPDNIDTFKKYPVVLFLHGAGERGDDNEKQLVHGSQLFLDSLSKYPAIVLFPQCPINSYWSNVNIVKYDDGGREFQFKNDGKPTESLLTVMNLMDSIQNLEWVDRSKIYVAGLSMGGMGTLELIYRKPKMFAAAISICGGANPNTSNTFAREVALWVFHGAKDDVVDPKYSQILVEEIQKRGGDVRFSLYPEANHNSWDRAFAEPELLSWLFSNSK